jgi:hypothetical protein
MNQYLALPKRASLGGCAQIILCWGWAVTFFPCQVDFPQTVPCTIYRLIACVYCIPKGTVRFVDKEVNRN